MMGSEVRMAADGVQAVAVAEDFRPDLIFLDVDMPLMNGLEAARAIRERSWSQGVLICALTGYGQQRDREKSLAAGIDMHLVKPVDAELLRGIMTHRAR